MNGIDISSYQTGINLEEVPGDFVIIKATEGTSYVNPACNDQYMSAKKAGKKIGLYHFASNGTTADEQANYFVDNVENYLIEGHSVAFLDWEAEAVNMGTQWAKKFLDTVAKRIDATPMIYMSKSVTNSFDWTEVSSEYALWGAQYATMEPQVGYDSDPWSDESSWGTWGTPTIFQYSSNGRLTGWNDSLDLNLAYLDQKSWDKFTNLKN